MPVILSFCPLLLRFLLSWPTEYMFQRWKKKMNKMNIIQVLFLTPKYHQGYNFIPSVKHVGKNLNESGWKDEMQNILNFKDENIAWAIFQGQDGYFN